MTVRINEVLLYEKHSVFMWAHAVPKSTHLEEETEANPLVVSVVFLVACSATRIINSFKWNFFPHGFVERWLESVGGMDPTEGV